MFHKLGLALCALLTMSAVHTATRQPLEKTPLCPSTIVAPEYATFARQGALQGVVRAKISVNSEGKGISIEMLDGNPYLQHFTMRALEQWRFMPCPSADCEAVITFNFKLEGDRTNFWTPTKVRFSSPYTMDIITNPAEPIRDYVP